MPASGFLAATFLIICVFLIKGGERVKEVGKGFGLLARGVSKTKGGCRILALEEVEHLPEV